MEILLAAFILAMLLGFSWFGLKALWGALIGACLYAAWKTKVSKCIKCQKRPMAIENIGFCTGCGGTQPATENTRRAFVLWVATTMALTSFSSFALGWLVTKKWSAPLLDLPVSDAIFFAVTFFAISVLPLAWALTKPLGLKLTVWCEHCGKLARNELRLNFCGHCGASQTKGHD